MTDQETSVANFFETELTTEMGATDLSATVASTSGLTSPAFLVIEPDTASQREVILFDGTFTGTTFVTSTINNRYLAGSGAGSGITHPVGSKVRSAPLAQHLDDLNDRVDADAAAFASHGSRHALAGADPLPADSVDTTQLADNAVTSAKIADGTIATADIATDAVTGAKIANFTIGPGQIGADAVTTVKILNSNVTGAKIADNAVTSAKIADGTIATADIANKAVTGAKIADNTIGPGQIGAAAVETAEIADGAVTGAKAAGDFASGIEVDNSTTVATQSLTNTMANIASVTLNIPTSWGSWKCFAYASYEYNLGFGSYTYHTVVRIDGVDGEEKDIPVVLPTGNDAVTSDGSNGAHRTGITTTGNRTISLRAKETGSRGSLDNVFLYARAVRTS